MRLATTTVLAVLTSVTALAGDDALRDALRPYGQGRRPGVAIVALRNGRVESIAAAGLADVEGRRQLAADTPLHLASVGKQMTAVAILKLVERGALRVDDPAVTLLPELRGWGDAVTIRNLLQHTSGVPDYYGHYSRARRPPTNQEALALLARWHRLDFAPGTKHDYSNAGYDLLSIVIERTAKVPFSTFMQREIFGPLGMHNTFAFDQARRKRAGAARGYRKNGGRWTLDDDSTLNLIHGSGSIYSSVDDMARYDAALFGGRIVSRKTLAEAFVPTRLRNGREVPYGFGWGIGNEEVSHDGAWMGFVSYYLHREDGVSVIVLSNDASADTEEIARTVARKVGN